MQIRSNFSLEFHESQARSDAMKGDELFKKGNAQEATYMMTSAVFHQLTAMYKLQATQSQIQYTVANGVNGEDTRD